MMTNPRRQQGDWHQIILAYYALILYQEGREIEAVSYAAAYLHQTTSEEINPKVKGLVANLEEKLPNTEFQAAVSRGQQWDIDTVMRVGFNII